MGRSAEGRPRVRISGRAKDLIHSGRERRAAEMDVVERWARHDPHGSPMVGFGCWTYGIYIYISHKPPFYDHLGKMNGHMIWSLTLIGCPIFRQSHFQIVGTCWNILVNLNDSVMFTRNSVTPRKMKVVFFPGKLAETNQGNEELLSGIDPQNNDCSGISWTNIGI